MMLVNRWGFCWCCYGESSFRSVRSCSNQIEEADLPNFQNMFMTICHVIDPCGSGWRVLLLEAGPDESEASDIPVLANSMQGGLFDWQYKVMGNQTKIVSTFCEILNSRVTNQYQLVQFSDRASTGPRMSWAGGRPDELAKGKGLSCKVISHVGNQSEGKMIKSIFQHYEQCILFAKDQNSS